MRGFHAKDRVFGWGFLCFFRPSRLNLRSKNIKTSLGSVGGRVPSLREPLDGLKLINRLVCQFSSKSVRYVTFFGKFLEVSDWSAAFGSARHHVIALKN